MTHFAKNVRDSQPAIAAFFDGCPVPAFAINADHVITHWNKACEQVLYLPAGSMIGTCNHWMPFFKEPHPLLADFIVDGVLEKTVRNYYHEEENFRNSPVISGAFEAERFFLHLGSSGRWLYFSAAPLHDADGNIVGAIQVLQDITEQKTAETAFSATQQELEMLVLKRTQQLAQANAHMACDIRQRERAEQELIRRNAELTELNRQLSRTQEQLMQSERMASIGQLAAGVAHEINNPIGYVSSNFGMLESYIDSLLGILAAYQEAEANIVAPQVLAMLQKMRTQMELDYLKEDIYALMGESHEGIQRVRRIVQDLKDFSRVDTALEWQWADLHQGIESTLNIVNSELRYTADVIRKYGDLPEVECIPSQINQVILNLVVNAAHAIDKERGEITICTSVYDAQVRIEVSDNGCGIESTHLPRIFDPFFTTKAIGRGTGLGLSLSYGIIQTHGGRIDVVSEPGHGSSFCVSFPLRRSVAPPR